MHIFDYSFLDEGLLPAEIVNLTATITAFNAISDTRKESNKSIYTELEKIARVQSVKGSNAIEGIVTTDARIKQIVDGDSAPLNHDEREIAGYRDALDEIGIIMLMISCGLIIIVSYIIADFIKRPLNELAARMQQVGQQNFETVPIKHKQSQPGEIVVIRNRFEEMTEQIDELVNKVYMDEIYQKNMEYENLVNQINPHFIYNVLQLIQSKAVLSENYEIDDIVVSLSRMMRYTMSNNSKMVTIKEETDYVRNYLDLYQKRYSRKFVYEINIEYIGDEQSEYLSAKLNHSGYMENKIKYPFAEYRVDL